MQQGQPSFFSKSIGPKAAALSTYDKECYGRAPVGPIVDRIKG
jgi:hypothetical protein